MSWEEKLIKENRKQHYREELKSGHHTGEKAKVIISYSHKNIA